MCLQKVYQSAQGISHRSELSGLQIQQLRSGLRRKGAEETRVKGCSLWRFLWEHVVLMHTQKQYLVLTNCDDMLQ